MAQNIFFVPPSLYGLIGSMWSGSSREEALFHIGDRPVNATWLLIGLHTIAMIAGTLATAFGSNGWRLILAFSTQEAIPHLSLWQFFTYPFVQDPSLWFAVDMLMLYWFGSELERSFGTKAFLSFYGALLIMPPLVFSLLGSWFPMLLAGTRILHFAIFIAFASLHPDAPMLFNLQAKWVASILLGLVFLQALASHQWLILLHYSLSSLLAWQGAHWFQESSPIDRFLEWREGRQEKAHTDKIEKQAKVLAKKEASIDSILEKISSQGMQSLTKNEKDALEKARAELLSKESKRGS